MISVELMKRQKLVGGQLTDCQSKSMVVFAGAGLARAVERPL